MMKLNEIGEKTAPPKQIKKIYTKLKFVKSEQNGAYIGFVSKKPDTGIILGVRQNADVKKKIVIVSTELSSTVIPNLLYSATLVPMKEKDGYIAIELSPIAFKASIETVYIPKIIYQVKVKFGGKTIMFDPIDGKKPSVSTISGVKELLEKRMDIDDQQQVIADFIDTANCLMKHYKGDGMETLIRKRKF